MMRKIYAAAILAAVLFGTMSLTAASPSVDDIFKKCIKAHGGDKFSKMKSYSSVMKMEVMGQSSQMKSNVVLPDKMRIDIEAGPENIIIILAGDKGWIRQNDTTVEIPEEMITMSKSQLSMQSNVVALGFLKYKEAGTTYELTGIEEVNGEPAYKLKETLKDSTVSDLYISTKTFLELKKVMTIDIQGTQGTVEMVYQEQKKIDGVTVPMKMEVTAMGIATVMTVSEFKVNPKLDEKLFKP